jgi:RHS repeat-associated protein
VIAKSDEDGYLYLNEEYQPYGEKIYATEDFFGGSDDWYTGKNYSEELDLSYFGARWYDAKQGRFLSIDPAGVTLENIHSFHRYVYAINNPYKYIDPDGREIVFVGTSFERDAISSAIDTIKDASPILKARIQELEESRNTHSIRFPKPGERPVNKTTGIRENESNGIGTGSETIVDPTKSLRIGTSSGPLTVSPESILVHELIGHGLDKDRGEINRDLNPSTGQKISEENAMFRANIYRRAKGETERSTY